MAIGFTQPNQSGVDHSNVQFPMNVSMQSQIAGDSASFLVEKFLQADSSFPQLHDLLKCSPDCPTLSGLHDIDYPNLKEFASTMKSVHHITKPSTISLPANILEQFSHMQQNCEMGLFSEIGRAWLTVDSNIFLWAYDNADDVAYFDGLTETIVSVGLIRPKPGIFREHIKYLLCLTTAVEIVLLGVTFSNDNGPRDFSDLLLLPEPMFSLATDNILMHVVAGTNNGRCFLAGKDGCLYEVVYQAEEGWFSRKCKKVNHTVSSFSFLLPSFLNTREDDYIVQIEIDDSRNILYTRSEKGTIDVYDLGEDGLQMTKVQSRSLSYLVQQASSIGRTIDPSNFKPIVGISAIEESESAIINLMAVTESGVRLYFTTTYNRSYIRPSTLNVLHVRLPPGFSASSNQRPSRVHLSLHNRNSSFFISSQTEERDILWILNNDPFPFSPNLIEVSTALSLNSRVWKMAEEIQPQLIKQLSATVISQLDRPVNLEPPLIVTQELEPSRKFVMLSSNGIHITYKPKPIDHLKQILQDNQGFDNEAVRGFFVLYKEVQACAIALSLACNENDKLVSEWATLALLKYGSESSSESTRAMNQQTLSNPNVSSFTQPQHISTPMPNHQGYSGYGISTPVSSPHPIHTSFISPVPQSPTMVNAQPQMIDPFIDFSNRHNGIYLYFSRIIRSIWGFKVVSSVTMSTQVGTKELLKSSITAEELILYIEKLSNLRDFLVKNIQLTPDNNSRANFQTMSLAQIEKSSLHNLLQLVKNCLEILGLWKILQDHQFHTITECLTSDYLAHLKNYTFRDIIVSGGEVCARLASALVQKFIEDNATTDAISKRLNDACPSIYRQENALHAKAHEILVRARTIANETERSKLVEEGALLFKRVGAKINLRQACDLLQAVNSYKHIVDLCIQTASQRDPQNLALNYYRNGETPEDLAGRQSYLTRNDCYSVMLEGLEFLYQQSQNPLQPSSSPSRVSGDLTLVSSSLMSAENAKKYSDLVINEAIESKDELLNVALFDWLYQHRDNDRLLKIKSPYLESYLKRKTSNYSESVALMDLLWMFYERNGHYRAAAEILSKLTERHGTDVDIYQRLQYLARSIVCMKSCQTPAMSGVDSVSSGEFLHELEEKMQVASIQLQLLEAIQRQGDAQMFVEAISRLNSDLYDVSQLYEIAEKFRLPEIQLSIVSTANHYDPAMIDSFWQRIMEREIRENSHQPNDTFKAVILNKTETLGRQYLSSEKYFPITFIVAYLEEKTQSRNFEPQWLAQTLVNIGVSLTNLIDIYHRLYKTRNLNTVWPSKETQIMKVIVFLLAEFLKNQSSVARNERRSFITKCLDIISGYILDLQATAGSNSAARSLMPELRELQNKFERLSA